MPGKRFPGVYQRCRRELVDGREVSPLAIQEGADGAMQLDLETLVLLVVELQ